MRRTFVPATCALALLAALGCGGGGGSSLPPETDAAKGRELLKTVLETWKRGGTPDELKATATVSDPDWAAGRKLAAYEIGPEDGRKGVDLLLSVKIIVDRGEGKPQTRTVRYVVAGTGPMVVMRDE